MTSMQCQSIRLEQLVDKERPAEPFMTDREMSFLIGLIRRAQIAGVDRHMLGKGISFLCRGESVPFYRRVESQSPLMPVILGDVSIKQVRSAVEKLMHRLAIRRGLAIFLLNDASGLQTKYEKVVLTNAIGLKVNRASLGTGSHSTYWRLASLVNESAFAADGEWDLFLSGYKLRLMEAREEDAAIEAAVHEVNEQLICQHAVLKQSIASHRGITIVDTGMQGTFALFAATLLRAMLGSENIDVDFVGAYPWLAQLFAGRFSTTDADVVLRLEQESL